MMNNLILRSSELIQLQKLRDSIEYNIKLMDSFIDNDAEEIYKQLVDLRLKIQKFISLHV